LCKQFQRKNGIDGPSLFAERFQVDPNIKYFQIYLSKYDTHEEVSFMAVKPRWYLKTLRAFTYFFSSSLSCVLASAYTHVFYR